MITPDTKDWTWVLDRPCPECGFDASTCPAPAVPGLTRDNAAGWRRLLAEGAIRPGRPGGGTWSTLEYACHVRDVYRRYRARTALMLHEDDPLFPNWDQDATAVEERYEEQDPAQVVDGLEAAAGALAVQLAAHGGRMGPARPPERRRLVQGRDDRPLHDPRPDPPPVGRRGAGAALSRAGRLRSRAAPSACPARPPGGGSAGCPRGSGRPGSGPRARPLP